MQKRKFGPQFETTAIGFGGGAISGEGGGYGFGNIDEKEACRVLEHAFERGIRLFDTAPIYGFGTSEKRIGLALSRHKDLRKQMLLVSKLGVTWDENKKVRTDNSPDVTWKMLEQSLRDLQTEYLDVYMIHWPDNNTPVEKTMETLVKMKEQGLIRSIGASNFNTELIARAETVASIDVLQGDFSLFDNQLAGQLFPVCKAKNKGFMSYGTLAKGMLAGSIRSDRKFDENDFRGRNASFMQKANALSQCIDEFETIARAEVKTTPAQLAVAWVLSHEQVSVALCGSKNTKQIDEVIDGAQITLSSNVISKLNTLSERATKIFVESSK